MPSRSRTRPARPGDLVEVTWVDAYESSEWDSKPGLSSVRSVGWVHEIDKRSLSLVRSYGKNPGSDSEATGDMLTIPRAWAEDIWVLRRKR